MQEQALRAILPRCWRTATDGLGRHVLEKFFEIGSFESKLRLAREGLSGGVLRLSLHPHGCHVIQAALPAVALEDAQEALVAEMRGKVWELAQSPHGNFVLQKLLITLPAPCLGFVLQECLPRAATCARHIYGCRILQRLLEAYPLSSAPMESLLEMLLGENFSELVTDPYGNYVLQHLLEVGRNQDKKRLIEKLVPRVEQYAVHRCASNLVERRCGPRRSCS